MRIFVYPGDRGPCGHYRLIWPAKVLRNRGIFHIDIAPGRFPRSEVQHIIADLVVMQRPTDRRLLEAVEHLRDRGIAVVVDMDDDLSAVHPRNHSYDQIVPLHHNALRACRSASLVTTTTPALAEVYGPDPAASPNERRRSRTPVVIPNCVPESYLRTPHRDSNLIGWAGAIATHPNDLQAMGDAMFRMVDRHRADVFVAGDSAGVARAWKLEEEVRSSGTVGLSDWSVLVSRIGLGVAPLEDSAFNNSKSRLKPLEYSAVGVPWIGSPSPDYKALHEQGAGLLAYSPDEWYSQLLRLWRDPNLRGELADAGREVARANTIEANALRWAEAWTSAVDQERT